MARVKLGSVVSLVRGSVGGSTFAGSGSAAAVRGKASERLVQAPRQLQVRSWLANLSTRWSHTLTDAQRAAWRAAGSGRLPGQILYISGNLARFDADLGVQDDAPVDVAPSALISALVQATAPDEAFVYFEPSSLASGERLYLYASRPRQSPRVMTRAAMTFLGVSPDGQVSPYDVGPTLATRFGDLQAGDWVSLFVAILQDDGGVLGPGLLLTYPQGEVQAAPPVVEGDFMLPTIDTLGPYSLGIDASGQAITAPASVAWGANNRALFAPFVVTRNFTVQTLWWFNGATLGSNVDCGIYDSSLGLLLSTGSVAQVGLNTLQLVAVMPTVLVPGHYYLALSLSLSTGTIFQGSLTTAARARAAGVLQADGVFPLTTLPTLVATANIGVRVYGASELAQVF